MIIRKEIIEHIFCSDGNKLNCNFPKKYPNLWLHILVCTNFIDYDIKFSQRVFLYLNGYSNHPKCLHCSNDVRLRSLNHKGLFCSPSCSSTHYLTREKYIDSSFKKYGTEHPSQSIIVREKTRKTNISRYGVDNPAKNEEIKNKITSSCISSLGVKYPLQNQEIKNKLVKTLLDKYGVENIMHIHRARFNGSVEDETIDILYNSIKLAKLYNGNCVTLANRLGVSPQTIRNRLHEFDINIYRNKESFLHSQIHNFLSSLNIKVVVNSKDIIKPLELDIYMPEYNLAIEIDGVYWHTENRGKDRKYHLNKTILCAEKGIQLLHIWDTDNIEIWKNIIGDKLGLLQNLYAKECIINFIPLPSKFIQHNHLQGSTPTLINYGLFYEDMLVAVMTFNKARFSDANWELVRFCTKSGYRVLGGASKLLFRFRKDHYGPIISYANLRWSIGKLYDTLGFKLLYRSKPDYFYTKDHRKLHSRNEFQKHMLKDNYDYDYTKWENMRNNGWDRIWDCGNLVYLLD